MVWDSSAILLNCIIICNRIKYFDDLYDLIDRIDLLSCYNFDVSCRFFYIPQHAFDLVSKVSSGSISLADEFLN